MRKRTFLRAFATVVLLATANLVAFAADYVKVSDSDGKATFFALSEKPVVTFNSTSLVLTTTSQVVEYPLVSYRSFEFVNESAGVESTNVETAKFSFGNTLKGEGLPPGSKLAVFSIDGKLLASTVVANNGTAEIEISSFAGVLIVKSSSKTFKFIKK